MTEKMNRKDWNNLTDELLADYQSRSFEQMQEIETVVRNLMPRETHPSPVGLLIAEIKRLRKDNESIAEEAIQEFLTLNPHLEDAKDMMCILKDVGIDFDVIKKMESKNYESD